MTNATAADRGETVTGPFRERRKAVLFCPRCGHESPAAGDWEHHAGEDGVALRCPDCRTRIAERPR